ncbi:MAG: ATP-binding cassette domain-containing protein [Caldisericia bacterium]|jgi:ABC-2 type transport system ATP-binding protein|nr:ATP-binding cassette domain-containing protein [Caldisericia bacterium]
MEEIIRIENLKKIYSNGVEAVKGISFSIEKGEIFGFLGPNGAGKTTTIKVIIGLLKLTSGKVYVDGIDISKNPNGVRNLIGYASQETSVDDNLTGWENLYIQGKLYHIPIKEIEKRGKDLLTLFNLWDRRFDLVSTYSGGMRKRLDISLALIHRPKILFLDEPTLGLDIQTRVSIWEYIRKLRYDFGMTIFLTTHYMEEADELCDRVAIIDMGEIKAIDKPGKLKEIIGGDIITFTLKESDNKNLFLDRIKTLSSVSNVKLLQNGIYQVIVNQNGDRLIPEIFKIAQEFQVEIDSIRSKRPSLDDVYLHFTGKTIRESEESKEDVFRRNLTIKRARR